MSIADSPDAHDAQADPPHLTGMFTANPDGWITAQIEEFPAAISQGRTEREAWQNVLDAYHDLTHEPTSTERLIYGVQAQAERALGLLDDVLVPLFERSGRSILDVLARPGRDRVH